MINKNRTIWNVNIFFNNNSCSYNNTINLKYTVMRILDNAFNNSFLNKLLHRFKTSKIKKISLITCLKILIIYFSFRRDSHNILLQGFFNSGSKIIKNGMRAQMMHEHRITLDERALCKKFNLLTSK